MINTRYVLKVDLNDNWVEIEILIVAHKLLIEKYGFLTEIGADLEISPMYLPLAV